MVIKLVYKPQILKHGGSYLTFSGSYCMTLSTIEAVLYTMPAIWNGETIGRGSNRLGWLHTLRNCIRMFI